MKYELNLSLDHMNLPVQTKIGNNVGTSFEA